MRRLNRQAGLSLLELSIALTIASAVVVWQFRVTSDKLRLAFWEDESKWVAGVLGDIQQQMGQTNFEALSNLTLGALRSVPTQYKTLGEGRTDVINGFGGKVYVKSMQLGSAAPHSSYALTYTHIPDYACTRMVVLLINATKSPVPLYGVVGESGAISGVPLTIGMDTSGDVTASGTGQTVLMPKSSAGLDMEKLGIFCKSAKALHLTLIRRPGN